MAACDVLETAVLRAVLDEYDRVVYTVSRGPPLTDHALSLKQLRQLRLPSRIAVDLNHVAVLYVMDGDKDGLFSKGDLSKFARWAVAVVSDGTPEEELKEFIHARCVLEMRHQCRREQQHRVGDEEGVADQGGMWAWHPPSHRCSVERPALASYHSPRRTKPQRTAPSGASRLDVEAAVSWFIKLLARNYGCGNAPAPPCVGEPGNLAPPQSQQDVGAPTAPLSNETQDMALTPQPSRDSVVGEVVDTWDATIMMSPTSGEQLATVEIDLECSITHNEIGSSLVETLVRAKHCAAKNRVLEDDCISMEGVTELYHCLLVRKHYGMTLAALCDMLNPHVAPGPQSVNRGDDVVVSLSASSADSAVDSWEGRCSGDTGDTAKNHCGGVGCRSGDPSSVAEDTTSDVVILMEETVHPFIFDAPVSCPQPQPIGMRCSSADSSVSSFRWVNDDRQRAEEKVLPPAEVTSADSDNDAFQHPISIINRKTRDPSRNARETGPSAPSTSSTSTVSFHHIEEEVPPHMDQAGLGSGELTGAVPASSGAEASEGCDSTHSAAISAQNAAVSPETSSSGSQQECTESVDAEGTIREPAIVQPIMHDAGVTYVAPLHTVACLLTAFFESYWDTLDTLGVCGNVESLCS